MTVDEARAHLRASIEAEGTAKAWADKHGIAASYVSDVLNGRRDISAAIMRPLGLRRVVTYEIAEASSVDARDPTSGDGVGGDCGSPCGRPHGS